MTGAKSTGQVLAFLALVMPVVLLPVAAYAVDAAMVAGRSAGLQAATAIAAEAAAQQLNVGVMRTGGVLALDVAAATNAAARTISEEEPSASVEWSSVKGLNVIVVTSERLTLPFSIFNRAITLHARATARLVVGYEAPV